MGWKFIILQELQVSTVCPQLVWELNNILLTSDNLEVLGKTRSFGKNYVVTSVEELTSLQKIVHAV